MNKSESINELAAALSKAQSEMDKASKGKENPFFKSLYSRLSDVQDACMPALTKNGLSVSQLPCMVGENVGLETILMHSSGQWISSIACIKPVKNDPQSIGSALSYARRYALSAIAGVSQDDDDANAAQDLSHKPSQLALKQQQVAKLPETKAKPVVEPTGFFINEAQLTDVVKRARFAGWADNEIKTKLSGITGKPDSSAWTKQDFDKVIAHFENLKAANPQNEMRM